MEGIAKKLRTALANTVLTSAAMLLLGSLAASPAFGQCSDIWMGGTTGNWSPGANWSNGKEPGASDSVCITSTPGASVTMDVSDGIADLTLGAGNSLTLPGPGGGIPNLGVGSSSSGNGSYSIVNNGEILM